MISVDQHKQICAALDELPYVRLQLDLALTSKSPGSSEGGHSKASFPSIPLRGEVDAMIREVNDSVQCWSTVVGYEMGVQTPARGFTSQTRRIRHNLDTLYAAREYEITRWVPSSKVSALPVSTEGTVTASGDALVRFWADGTYAINELMALYNRASRLIQ